MIGSFLRFVDDGTAELSLLIQWCVRAEIGGKCESMVSSEECSMK